MLLKLQNVTVVYPDKTKAIVNLSCTLNAGENIALIGENGAGKTSLLLAIAGILKAEGVIETPKQIGLVFQNPDDQLFMPFIYDDVAFGCRNLGFSEEQVKTKVEETLEQLNISHLKNRSSLKLSCGEKRMAAIATVLSMSPSILMFDEPTAYLDPKARRLLAETLKKMQHEKIIATHDLAFAAEVCNRVIALKDGSIIADGPKDLLHNEELMQTLGF
ncbi:MAG: energy-coupling factor ABC transporter ATP-binding protein [Fibromonadaceae bacterium]|jgi:cobalt/nickel transport system ATP-binding protein|nr:energy-coupling factor ABC transporter ATP-binding protein [Fibromonadaceae bacterium]